MSSSDPRLSFEALRVTIMAAAIETMNAGIWETSPSPTVKIV